MATTRALSPSGLASYTSTGQAARRPLPLNRSPSWTMTPRPASSLSPHYSDTFPRPLSPKQQDTFTRLALSGNDSLRERGTRFCPKQQSPIAVTTKLRRPHQTELPPLPRYHPANYLSACTSAQGTPPSPGRKLHVYTEAQRKWYEHRTLLPVDMQEDPAKGRLGPSSSPCGPITPLELDESCMDGFLGARRASIHGVEQSPLAQQVG